jgi:hypothetical protein
MQSQEQINGDVCKKSRKQTDSKISRFDFAGRDVIFPLLFQSRQSVSK